MTKNNIEYLAVSTSDELGRYKEQWDTLEKQATQRSVMLSYAWISNHFEFFVAPGLSWTCLIAVLNERLVAILPLVLETRSWPVPHLVGRSAFGSHLNIADILCVARDREDILCGLLKFAFSRYRKLAYIELPRVPDSSPTMKTDPTKLTPLTMSRIEKSYGYYLPIPDDFSEYERSLGRNFRSNLKKATNKLAKLEGVEFEVLDSGDGLQENLKRFCDIERSGWKGRSGTAIGESDLLVTFYSAALKSLQGIGALEWHFLKGAGQDLAGHMAFRLRGKLVLWKLAYNESFAKCSPGGQLMREVIRREAEQRDCGEIDLTTDQGWYRNWNLLKRPYFQLRIYNRRSPISILHMVIHRARYTARQSPFLQGCRKVLRKFAGSSHNE